MKKMIYLLLIPVLIAGLFAMDSMDIFSGEAAASGATGAEGNIVTVNGMGTVKVKPDIAYVNVGVEIFDTDAKKAQDDNAKLMDKIVSNIKKNGIKDEDIKTISYDIYKSTKYEPASFGGKENRIEGYYSRNVVEITVRDIENVGKIADLAGEAGANVIGNIRFGISDEDKYYNEALKLAMENAKGKANTILSTFGAKADKPYRVQENSSGAPIIYREAAMMKSAMADEAFNTPIETGELEVTARLSVEYKY
ncbi:SIMPL domain-containing protein [Wukongibacter baidiensis]|uniref:SIMPL domain-containing protein n=1 Tax=Wukongibacter baidiensis TaxID=1723361 RepID=UPI003D7F9D43